MEIFEYIRTSFHVIKAFVTQDKLIYIGLGVLGLFILWTILSLVLSHEFKMERLWRKMTKEIEDGKMTKEKYFAFTKYIQKMPTSVQRNWRKYEIKKTGMPSDYITQEDMLDNPIGGGIRKQNRSLMKFAMWSVTIFAFALSLSSMGASEPITAEVFVESAIVPFILFMLFRLNYYIYTAIRQYEYRLAVDDFNEFINFVDSIISIEDIFEGDDDFLQVNSNCFYTSHKTIQNPTQSSREVEPIVFKTESNNKQVEEKKTESKPVELKKEYEFYRTKSGKIELRSRQDFSEALMVVEKLLDEKPKGSKQSDEKSKRVAELMEAMNKYRNKKLK